MKSIPSQIIKYDQDIIFTTKDGDLLEVASINLQDGIITNVTTIYEDTYSRDALNIYTNILYVKGVGSLVPKTRVVYEKKDYILLYGWHTNISNQTIYSWFLRPLEEAGPDKTLYKEMIDKIDIIHFD